MRDVLGARRGAHPPPEIAVADQAPEREQELVTISRTDQEAGALVRNEIGNAAEPRADHWLAVGHRLGNRQRLPFGCRRQHEDIDLCHYVVHVLEAADERNGLARALLTGIGPQRLDDWTVSRDEQGDGQALRT